jgi:SAM-dependent methyltransferase
VVSPTAGGDPAGATGPALHHHAAYFHHQYTASPDPWGFDTEWYELRKRALTLAALPRPRYRRGVEAGCANGALTAGLARRCDELVAFDLLAEPVARARLRLADQPHVRFATAALPSFWPDGTGDLVVWSEVAYYLTERGAEAAVDGLRRWLEPGGTLVAVHYTGTTDYPRQGGEIGPWLDEVPELQRTTTLRDPRFELGVWIRRPPT